MGLDNPVHIVFLLILLLLVFGAKRLPEMGRSLGSGMRGFKDALSGEDARPSDARSSDAGPSSLVREQNAAVVSRDGAPALAAAPMAIAAQRPLAAPVSGGEPPSA